MEKILHVRFEGKSFDIPLKHLEIETSTSVRKIRAALAVYLDVAESRFANYVVEKQASGDITLRPEAVFG